MTMHLAHDWIPAVQPWYKEDIFPTVERFVIISNEFLCASPLAYINHYLLVL